MCQYKINAKRQIPYLLEQKEFASIFYLSGIIYKKDRQPSCVYGHFPPVRQVPFYILQNP